MSGSVDPIGRAAGEIDEVLAALTAGLIPTAALNSYRGALSEAPALVPEWIKPRTGVIKAIIEI